MPIESTLAFVRARSSGPVALCGSRQSLQGITALADPTALGVAHLIDWQAGESQPPEIGGLVPLSINQAVAAGVDAVVLVDEQNFKSILRDIEPLAHRGALILPQEPGWVTWDLASYSPGDIAWKTSADANYVARSGLHGHYLEFGTFWGGSFFPNYYRYRPWLQGKFFAFDSFAGLSTPLPEESLYTGGDFRAGTYCSNARSFAALAEFVGMPPDRCVIVPGFYSETVAGQSPAQYGLEPQSVSVCVIDCDLKEPTGQVLEFITPLMEPGGLLYFDDWRLCRASPEVGERAAALHWLRKNPGIELVELHRTSWQHQWFIFWNTGVS